MDDQSHPFQPAPSREVTGEKPEYLYDFFLAHAGADKGAAEELFDLLPPPYRVFLDTRCLKLGDDWDVEISKAQRRSRITVVLVSSLTEVAYYQREEIAAAINMARRDTHRVVPIYLDGRPDAESEVHYGLRLRHGLSAGDEGGLEHVASRLKELLAQLVGEASTSAGTAPNRVAPQGSNSRSGGVGAGRAPEPSIYIGESVKGQNVVIGGSQTVHGNLNITMGTAAQESARETLRRRAEQLLDALEMLPSVPDGGADEVRMAVEDALDEASREVPNKRRLEVRAETLRKAAERLAALSPDVYRLALQVASTLTTVG
jgi:hypothetical protein